METPVQSAQAGDPAAWKSLYLRHQPWLYAAALHICRDHQLAKDAVQDTFVQAYLHLGRLKDPLAFPAWLKKIHFRNCLHLSKQKTTLDLSLSNAAVEYTERNVSTIVERDDKLTKLFNALGSLTIPLQTVLLLRYFSNWHSYAKISTILSIPEGTVRSRLNDAKTKLARCWLEADCDNEDVLRAAEEWNQYYTSKFESIYFSAAARDQFTAHFDKNLQLIFTSGNICYGRQYIETEIEKDLQYGNRFCDINVSTNGNLSVVEVSNVNSAAYPDRCPDRGIFIMHRNNNKVQRLHFHNSR